MIRIHNGTVYDPVSGKITKMNLDIENGKIKRVYHENEAMDENTPAKDIDATGLIITRGFLDVHVHFRDPGLTYKEDIYTGALCAAKGGYTDVVMMANTKPTVDNAETLLYVINKGKETKINVHAAASVSVGLKGEKLTDFDELKAKGAVGFTDDGIPLMDEDLLKEALIKARELDVPISLHEEDKNYIKENGINHGVASSHYGIYGSPSVAESSLIERDVLIALNTGGKLNVQHISTKEGVNAVRNAKKKGNNIFAEVTPHHLFLNEDAVIKYGSNAKMNPPLRTEEDRMAILEGVKDGTISMIATDHAPHSTEEKSGDITKVPSGIIGLETAFSVSYEALVLSNTISLMEMIKMLTVNPRTLYNMSNEEIIPGTSGDLVLINLDEDWIYDKSVSKSENTPFMGKTMKGKIKYTICKGEVAYEDI